MIDETPRQRILRTLAALKTERASFLPHWRELCEHTQPRSARFAVSDRNRGDKRNTRLLDNTSTLAVRALASGMMAGVTNPARPWFRLALARPGTRVTPEIRAWLHRLEEQMREIFIRSNLYNVLPIAYADLGIYGTHCMAVMEDEDDVIRCYPVPVGSYVVSNSHRLQVDTVVREFQMTVRQLVAQFGLSKVSRSVRNAWETGSREAWIDVIHYVAPNQDYDAKRPAARYKKFASVYLEVASEEDTLLSESGFDEMPYLAPRWTATGEDVYGASPGMDALPDIKALQILQKRKITLIDKGTNPAMKAPSSMRNTRASMLPGDITYLDAQPGQQSFEPAYAPNHGWVQGMSQEIAETQHRIRRAFFEDLFLMLANDQRSGVTAREIDERHEEKLLMLGPVLERLNDELLDPLIDRTFEIMVRLGAMPPPPPEAQGEPLKVEYISIMAQAMRMVGLGGVERLMGFVGNLAGANPAVLDKIGMDRAVDAYAEMVGVQPGIVLADKEVAMIRAARAQQQAAAQAMQVAQAGAQGAKLLSETDTTQDNALTRMLGVA